MKTMGDVTYLKERIIHKPKNDYASTNGIYFYGSTECLTASLPSTHAEMPPYAISLDLGYDTYRGEDYFP